VQISQTWGLLTGSPLLSCVTEAPAVFITTILCVPEGDKIAEDEVFIFGLVELFCCEAFAGIVMVVTVVFESTSPDSVLILAAWTRRSS
jgi:hypothetical protein